MATVSPLIVITGPTASGKSSLALQLAEKWGGEIICADSRTVYKTMDVGTAKPTSIEQKLVRHWLLDVAEPGERFTVADFQRMALAAIADIHSRGKIPFLVGGTGLYIDAVVLNFVFGSDVDFQARSMLEKLSIEQLVSLHIKQRILLPENQKNKRYLIRSIEKNNSSTSRNLLPEPNTFVFAIQTEKAVLLERIRTRVDDMFAHNLVFETQQLLQRYGHHGEAMTGNVYRIVSRYIDGEIDERMAKQLCVIRDRQLAKRQITWLKRHGYVRWLTPKDAMDTIETILKKYRDA